MKSLLVKIKHNFSLFIAKMQIAGLEAAAYGNILSMPVCQKRQISMMHRFLFFSVILFLLIFISGNAAFIILMNKIHYDNAGQKLMQTVEIEQLKMEASINSEIAIALRMADSPLIQWYFLDPDDEDMKQFALGEIAGYRKYFASNSVFWVNDIDKKFYFDEAYAYTVDTADQNDYWYMLTLNGEKRYNFNINYNPALDVTNLWINVAVYDSQNKPIGIVGTSINLADFINTVYQNYSRTEELYFFNAAGEITGAKDITLVEDKINIAKLLGKTGGEILAKAKELKNRESKYFKAKDNLQIIAVGSIRELDWYITAIYPFTIGSFLQTGMTVLFGVMMAVILIIFIVFNIFIIGMLKPLNQIVKIIRETFTDLDFKPQENRDNKDEVETLGDFFYLTVIDHLTGIYNRRYLDGSLKKIIKLHSRTGSSLSVLMIDIDYFKKYNDAYGHDAGDVCLKKVTAVLSQCVIRHGDFVARYGGEEFAAVLPNTDKNGAQLLAEKMLEKIRECNIAHKASDIAGYVTVSIGGTTGVINHLQHGSDYIKAADKALYESKKNGRNRYTFMNLN